MMVAKGWRDVMEVVNREVRVDTSRVIFKKHVAEMENGMRFR